MNKKIQQINKKASETYVGYADNLHDKQEIKIDKNSQDIKSIIEFIENAGEPIYTADPYTHGILLDYVDETSVGVPSNENDYLYNFDLSTGNITEPSSNHTFQLTNSKETHSIVLSQGRSGSFIIKEGINVEILVHASWSASDVNSMDITYRSENAINDIPYIDKISVLIKNDYEPDIEDLKQQTQKINTSGDFDATLSLNGAPLIENDIIYSIKDSKGIVIKQNLDDQLAPIQTQVEENGDLINDNGGDTLTVISGDNLTQVANIHDSTIADHGGLISTNTNNIFINTSDIQNNTTKTQYLNTNGDEWKKVDEYISLNSPQQIIYKSYNHLFNGSDGLSKLDINDNEIKIFEQLNINDKPLINIPTPINNKDATNKEYVDSKIVAVPIGESPADVTGVLYLIEE